MDSWGQSYLIYTLPRFNNLLVLTEIKMNKEKNGNVQLEKKKTVWKTETLRDTEGRNSMEC